MTQFFETVEFPILGDARGQLISLEGNRNVPFSIARAYYIFGTAAGVSRGFHAHHTLRQLAVCVRGSCTMLLDNGREKREIRLNSPSLGVMIEPMVWHEMSDFTEDCILLVLADQVYDEADYIRDYDIFAEAVRRH
jgi:dTDP-4-dehydrorhamnose 3,5-epimerase-like enzyme